MKNTILVFIFLLSGYVTFSQETLKIKVIDIDTKEALPNVYVKVNGKMSGITDSLGMTAIILAQGSYKVDVITLGYKSQSVVFQLIDTNLHVIKLQTESKDLEEVTLVASTRNNQPIEISPLKVEVLGKQEISEEVGIRPGNIASILGDVSGVQIQQSSAVSGNANVRIQGLSGRYTQILRDGMPLFDGFSGGFGILTVPPLDLKQIELIKGSASTLYGGGAIAGLVNLISKRPTFNQEADIVANYTSLTELNLNTYISKRYKKTGYTLFAGYTHQNAQDVNNDLLSDVPDMSSVLIHPKLFYYPSDKTIISIGYSGTFDDRKGGDMLVLQNKADNTHQYFEQNKSRRNTGEYSLEHYFNNDKKLIVKGLIINFNKITSSNTFGLNATQLSYYNEASLSIKAGKADLVTGVDLSGENYKTLPPDSSIIKNIYNMTFGAFAQYTYHIRETTTLEAGLRSDIYNSSKVFVLPRIAFFHRIDEHFGLRAGFGMGYKTPDPFAQQDIDYNPLTIVYVPVSLKPELSYGYNLEGNYKKDWDKEHSLFINHAFFLTRVVDPLILAANSYNEIQLVNYPGMMNTMGFDTYLKLTLKKWELYGGYTYTQARGDYFLNKKVPLTPANRFAFVFVREIGEIWRFGLEGSFTGQQYRYDGTTTPSYMFIALMAQRNLVKHISLVLNCENLLDYRMSREESLYTGSISNPTFKPLWAPIDGRVINLSLRWKL